MNYQPDKIALSAKSVKHLRQLLRENPRLDEAIRLSSSEEVFKQHVQEWALEIIKENKAAVDYYTQEIKGRDAFNHLRWQDFAAIRILDYLDNAGRSFSNPYRGGEETITDPFQLLWFGVRFGTGGAKPLFFEDMTQLFRQLTRQMPDPKPDSNTILQWMSRWRHGLEPDIIAIRESNKERIIKVLAERINSCEDGDTRYKLPAHFTLEQRIETVREWWNDYKFHLRFAIRSPELLNELLDYSLDLDTLKVLEKAEKKGIPFFVNPYYLSLLNTSAAGLDVGADLAIRHYVLYSKQLIDQYGNIEAWEKEDKVEPGKPNAAGWLLPSHHNVHRRYPEVAILIPDTMGRACGGLCVSCQRMYDFQRGNLNFNIDKLKPKESWNDKMQRLLEYWEKDTQLRDILITGGDALMSQNNSLENILEAVYQMALRKHEANKQRPEGEKHAEIVRIRLGSRMPAYLPQRITEELVQILYNFREKAKAIGIKQFVIQTHFEAPMEVTPEAALAVKRLIGAGWTVNNQLVFTTAASRRGHTAMLRKVLNDIGIITYYTFSVKGFLENSFNYATNARAVQEQVEEKVLGQIPPEYYHTIREFADQPSKLCENIRMIRDELNIPFLSTDRNVINLPGVGKSLTFRTIGITRWGRRILEFDHDHTRWHSPIIHKMGKVIIIESKPIGEYLHQLEDMGENPQDYRSVWGYSIGETEARLPVFDYPKYDYSVTAEMTNLQI